MPAIFSKLTGSRGAVVAVAALIVAILKYRQRVRNARRRRQRQGATGADGGGRRARKKRTPSLTDFVKLLTPSLWSPAGRKALFLTLLCGMSTLLSDKAARLQGDIFKSVFTQAKSKFVGQLLRTIGMQFATSVLSTTIDTTVKHLSLAWHKNLYNELHKLYFRGLNHYKLSFVDKRVQSPEEIICVDVPALTSGMAEIYRDVLRAIFDGAFFTYRLAQETSPAWSSVTWAYVTVAVVSVRLVSPNFARLFSKRNKLRETFTSAFGRLVSNSEAIAALGGDAREKSIIARAFEDMQRHVSRIVKTQWRFGMIEDFVTKYAASTMAMVVILGPFFSGNLKSDATPEGNANTMASMRYVTSVIISQLTAVAGLARCLRKVMSLNSYVRRIGNMKTVLEEISQNVQDESLCIEDSDKISFKDVAITTPTGSKLVEDLSFEVCAGKNLLITGPNGAGKSSIFRCLGALWSITNGSIGRPGGSDSDKGLHDKVFYLPQKPYNVLGDLRDQIIYPITDEAPKRALDDETLRALLSLVDLEYLLDSGADKKVNWEQTLSLGETQRLAMARLFYHKPLFAILDECTSAVSNVMERRLYRLCNEKGITCITISHRPALIAFHDLKLELDGTGGYTLESLTAAADSSNGVAVHGDGAHADLDSSSSEDDLPLKLEQLNALSLKEEAASALPAFSALPSPLKKNGLTLKRFLKLLKFLVPSLSSKPSKMLLSLSAVVIARVWLSDKVAHMNGDTVRLLLLDDLPGFKRLVGVSLLQCVASSVLAPSLLYLTRALSLHWRDQTQRRIIDLMFSQKAFYKISHLYPDIKNVEQRATADIEKLCVELANTFPLIVKPIADLLWFSSQSVLLIGVRKTALLYTYVVVGFAILKIATPDFGSLVSRKSSLEGIFRYIQRRFRTHGESIAFFGGEDKESLIAQSAFQDIVSHTHRTYQAEYVYSIVDNFVVKQMPSIVTWTLSLLYAHQVSPSASYQNDTRKGGQLGHDLRYVASAVSHIFLASGQMLQLYRRFQELSGYSNRIIELEDFLVGLGDGASSARAIGGIVEASDQLSLTNADIVTPTGRLLVHDVTLTIPHGNHLLITGPNTSGKSSLFRVIGGLWPLRSGVLRKPGGSDATSVADIFLVPQRPYCASGTLADQITYPETADLEDADTIETLNAIMEKVNLSELVNGRHSWESVSNWEDVLSLGEQQRLGMARLFFHKPKYAVLDQCTDAVSVDIEEKLYSEAERLGITIITISQRAALTAHHASELKLLGTNAQYSLKAIQHQRN